MSFASGLYVMVIPVNIHPKKIRIKFGLLLPPAKVREP